MYFCLGPNGTTGTNGTTAQQAAGGTYLERRHMRERNSSEPIGIDGVQQLAQVLAVGILRLHARAALTTDPNRQAAQKKVPDSVPNCLEVHDETVLSVHKG